jgi:hypothetical protein
MEPDREKMSRIKVTYVACVYEDKQPIISADSFENLRKALDYYCGADERNLARCVGFVPHQVKYPSDYEGYYEYECCEDGKGWSKTYIDKFRVYCVEFWPETKEER